MRYGRRQDPVNRDTLGSRHDTGDLRDKYILSASPRGKQSFTDQIDGTVGVCHHCSKVTRDLCSTVPQKALLTAAAMVFHEDDHERLDGQISLYSASCL